MVTVVTRPTGMEDGGRVMWLGLAVSYFLLCRASELWAYADGKLHPGFCLVRECLTFLREGVQIEFGNRLTAAAVQIRFVASTCDQKRAGCTITRTRLSNEREMGGVLMGAFKILLEFLDVHPRGGAADSPGHVARVEIFH